MSRAESRVVVMVVALRSHIVSTSSMDRVMMVVTMTCGSHIVSTSVIASRIMVVMVSVRDRHDLDTSAIGTRGHV
jgi:hypothetical protein